MDFSIPPELTMFVDSVRQFREKELMPLEHEFLLQGRFDSHTRTALEDKARQHLLQDVDPLQIPLGPDTAISRED